MGCGERRFSPDHDACGVGLVAQLGSRGSHQIVARALEALRRLAHRGGVDADGRSGDGAGLLTALPETFLRREAERLGIQLSRIFAAGMVFLPRGGERICRETVEKTAAANGIRVLGWRQVPVDDSVIGQRAATTAPVVQQVFVAPAQETADFDCHLFRMRKAAEAAAPAGMYFCSLSSRTIVYKGLLTPEQLPAFYPDLRDRDFTSRFALFHQRYSTNTAPSWSLAQPFRMLAHNGEINTVRGNRRWFGARESGYRSELGLGGDAALLEEGLSDSGSFDNALEAWVRRGYEPAAAMLALSPPVVDAHRRGAGKLHDFLQAHAWQQEPWDGPAAVVFSDGVVVGAKLDRNGLRPLRYTLASDGLLVVGSETGIADFDGKEIVERSRLGPGDLLLANPGSGELLRPGEVVAATALPRSRSKVRRLVPGAVAAAPAAEGAKRAMASLGWTQDQFRLLFQPLAESGKDGVWSMGDDAAPAALSAHPRPLWDYCKQRFAQVTNPPIDSLRETHVMSLDVACGRGTILPSPVVDSEQLRHLELALGAAPHIDITFEAAAGVPGAKSALQRIRGEARRACERGCGLIVITDRAIDSARAAVPVLLATAAAWNEIEAAGGWRIPLVAETGEAFDTHHFAMLVASGAAAVLPHFALEQAAAISSCTKYRAAIDVGLLKVLARMGISALASYRNSRLFEIVGLDAEVCGEFFAGADATLGGKSLDDLLADALLRHANAYGRETPELNDAGLYRFRKNGERHASSPDLVRRLHRLAHAPGEEQARDYEELGERREPVAVRDLLDIVPGTPIPLARTESEAAILSRFSTQAMSLGAISPEAHRTLAVAMNRLGGRSNTGEGGEDARQRQEEPQAANRVKQVASARFGVTAEYLVTADELEIKIAQGAKPGEGGQLPAGKVTPYIASLRHASPNMTLISPPPHHDIYSIEDLAQLIYDLRAINPAARIGVKLVSSSGVGIIATGVAKAGADVITIAGHDGGTGASPLTSIKNTGLPWEIGLRDAQEALLRAGLRGRVRLRVDGGLKFARDVILAALLGADEFGFGTAALIAIGCVMARQCHMNTCPVGIATQDEKLRVRFTGSPEMVENYFRALAGEVRQKLAELGAASLSEIVGAVEFLRPRTLQAAKVIAPLLRPVAPTATLPCSPDELSTLPALLNATVEHYVASGQYAITTFDRAIGAHLSGQLIRRRRAAGETHSGLEYEFVGVAGQSFGAFLTPGVKFRLRGEANDYVGKGLSGGTIVISAGAEASLRGDVLAGNTVLYGATGGELYVAGRAGERFAVRNSGALAVVEGVGQHGCEYMTAGVVVVLGEVGRNFGAGMTGGLAYVPQDTPQGNANAESVRAAGLEDEEQYWLRGLLSRHARLTGSPIAARLLSQTRLSLQRIEPAQLSASVEETWARVLRQIGETAAPLGLAGEGTIREEPWVR